MADVLIRGLSDDEVEKIDNLASAADMSRQTWLKEVISNATKAHVVKERYAIKVYGLNGRGTIQRHGDGPNNVGGGFADFTANEADTFQKAKDFVIRNQPGDRERAIGILQNAFEEVFEQ